MLAQMAEVDERRLYLPAGYESMYLFCLRALHMSEDVAFKRIRVARVARRFPAMFPLLADGRLTLSAAVILAPHLAPDTAGALLAGVVHKTNAQVELLLAEQFPKPDVPALIQAIGASFEVVETAGRPDAPPPQLAVRPVVPAAVTNATLPVEPTPSRAKPVPLSPGRFAVQFTMDEEMYEELRQVQALLGHTLPSGDVGQVFRRALHELRRTLEKRKFAAADRPRPQRGTAKGRHIPASVKRGVRDRDGDRCTFTSDQGKRCEARSRLEFDHIEPLARGGRSIVSNLRLRCRAHNQHEADCAFGPEFMRAKREEARAITAGAKAAASAVAVP
jgi:5-methylcytosine-specific restriction endonuclease McrA